jgi:hypothetical protein
MTNRKKEKSVHPMIVVISSSCLYPSFAFRYVREIVIV